MIAATEPTTIAVDIQDERRGLLLRIRDERRRRRTGPGSARNGTGPGGFSFHRAASIRARAEGSLCSAESAHRRSNSRSPSCRSDIPVAFLEQSYPQDTTAPPPWGTRNGGAAKGTGVDHTSKK